MQLSVTNVEKRDMNWFQLGGRAISIVCAAIFGGSLF